MLIVFIGPPGAGKGTQAARLTRHFNIPHLSTGEMLRAAKAAGSDLGRLAAKYFDEGHLAPDPLVIQMVDEQLSRPEFARGCLLDGFPRTLGQARALDDLLQTRRTPLNAAIELQADPESLVTRMLARAKREHRADDTKETIGKRFEVYHSQTTPLLDYYRAQRKLIAIDALGTPDEVFSRIITQLQPSCQ